MSSPRRADLIAVSILVAITSLLFADVIVGTHNFYRRDLAHYYYPMKHMLREIVLAGEFPYWTRMISAGQPIAANPEHEVFYPATWLLLLPDYFLAFRLHILVHIYIAVLGMYAFLRSMALRATAAFTGALAFGLGGVFMSYINLLPIMFSAAWIPLICLYVRRYLLEPRLRWFALASLFFGLQFLVGEPTTIAQTGFILGMYALYRGWHAAHDDGRGWHTALPAMGRRVGGIALISLAAFAVGAAQMIPAIDHAGDSVRARGFEFDLVSRWSMPWAKLLELIYPNILGYVSAENSAWYWGRDLYPVNGAPFLFNIHPGLLATAVAGAALLSRRRGSGFVTMLVAGSFVLALGGHTPLLRALYDLGIAKSVRYPEKFALIGVFALIVFGSKMLQQIIDGDERLRRRAFLIAAVAAGLAGIAAILGFTPYYNSLYELARLEEALAPGLRAMSHRGWITATAHAAVLAAILWAYPRVRRPLGLAMIGAFAVANIAPIAHELNPRLPASYFLEAPEIAGSLPPDRGAYRVFYEADWYTHGKQAQRYFSTGPMMYWIVRAGLYPMMPAGHGIQTVIEADYDKTALLPTEDFTQSVWEVKDAGRRDWWRPFMAMSNAWFRAVHRDFASELRRVRGDLRFVRPIGFLAAEQWPRYYFADSLVTIRDRKDFVEKLSRGTYSDRVAFVARRAFVPSAGTVTSWRETSNTAVLEVEAAGTGFLVMSVTPHKYWRITIDGAVVEPVVTNIGYQGVVIPPGRHRVEMRYRNDLVLVGGAISIFSVLALLIALAVSRRTGTASGRLAASG